MNIRPRRMRAHPALRNLMRENTLTPDDLIAPLFVIDSADARTPIASMPGQARLNIPELIKEARHLAGLGVKTLALFPAIDERFKSPDAAHAWQADNLNFRAARALKEALPDVLLMGDIALDPYSSDGHDGLVDKKTGEILNDATLEALVKQGLASAKAGFDILGPSDMMDGRVGALRAALESEGHPNTVIMSYTAKYASAFYGPFRDALASAPKKGDKKTYQMDFANAREALTEAKLDEAEGADILMVKPGLAYLDVIYRLRQATTLPIAAYNVSGEYAMVKAAHERGWVDGERVMLETLMAFKRAGSDVILSYFAREAAELLHQ